MADGHGKVTLKLEKILSMSFRKVWGPFFTRSCEFKKIDDILSELSLQKPNIILMDIDAHEVSALKGMTSLLSSKELRAILIELRGSTFHSVNKILNSFNFTAKKFYQRFLAT